MWDMSDVFYDREDLVAQVQYLQDLISANRYLGWKGQPQSYIQRIESAVAALPAEHQEAALALFANVVYLPTPVLDEAWREITLQLDIRHGWSPDSGFKNALIIGIDDPGLITAFSHVAGASRREDHDVNPGYGTVSELIGALETFVIAKGEYEPIASNLRTIRAKKWWMVLTDNVLSGGSAKSDLLRVQTIREIFFPGRDIADSSLPKIVLCAQIITAQAFEELRSIIASDSIVYGLQFDDTFRISSPSCALFKEQKTLLAVQNLCEWFGDNVFLRAPDAHFKERLRVHRSKGGRKNYAYGWRDCGYTIVTQSNCPSNSVPVLYYTSTHPLVAKKGSSVPSRYISPFPRTESRESHQVSGDKESLNRLNTKENIALIQKAFK